MLNTITAGARERVCHERPLMAATPRFNARIGGKLERNRRHLFRNISIWSVYRWQQRHLTIFASKRNYCKRTDKSPVQSQYNRPEFAPFGDYFFVLFIMVHPLWPGSRLVEHKKLSTWDLILIKHFMFKWLRYVKYGVRIKFTYTEYLDIMHMSLFPINMHDVNILWYVDQQSLFWENCN